MEPEDRKLDIASVIVAIGYREYDPTQMAAFGHKRFDNVLTGLQCERLLNASGPTEGHVLRPSDDRVPKHLAWVQCVGSRGEGGNDYCSRFCCMNAIKGAMLAIQHEPDIETLTIFYTDIRAFGKGFEDFVSRAEDDPRIRFIRGRPSKILEDPDTKDLTLLVEVDDRPQRVPADMAILSCGSSPNEDTSQLASILGVDVGRDGFFASKEPGTTLIESTRSGVFLCGGAAGPQVIPEAVAQASGAAAEAAAYLDERSKLPEIEPPKEKIDPTGPVRIGVFVCHCGANIGGVIDVKKLADEAYRLPGVVFTSDELFSCAQVSQKHIQEMIADENLNRVVVAACTPRTHEPVFRAAIADAGLNPYMLEMANIRDQCTWVHATDPAGAEERARQQIRMAVARAARHEPLHPMTMPIEKRVLVIGGGIAGVDAALNVARRGIPVVLVENSDRLGGFIGKDKVSILYPRGTSATAWMKGRIDALTKAGVEVRTNSEVKSISGYVGNFEATIGPSGASLETATESVKCGAIIIATGAALYDPAGRFGYGTFPNVITNMDMERALCSEAGFTEILGEKKPKTVGFIQCVGSREECGNPGCSSYCCPTTVLQAFELRKMGIEVAVFYRDMRTVDSGTELLYREARGAGVIFVRLRDGTDVEVSGDERAAYLEADDVLLGERVRVAVDLVVLAVGMVPREPETTALHDMLKVPRGPDGFFLERHPELGPVETVVDGVFLCGTVQGPKGLEGSTAQASAAAVKAGVYLSKDHVTLDPTIAEVISELCRACETCVGVCPYHAISLVEEEGVRVARVTSAQCKGCGTCAAWCPTGAIRARHYTDSQMGAMVDAVLEELVR
jgi:heterodisulfide reductase subunit A-like polyferredoxin